MKKGSFKRGMALILCAVLVAEPSMDAAAADCAHLFSVDI